MDEDNYSLRNIYEKLRGSRAIDRINKMSEAASKMGHFGLVRARDDLDIALGRSKWIAMRQGKGEIFEQTKKRKTNYGEYQQVAYGKLTESFNEHSKNKRSLPEAQRIAQEFNDKLDKLTGDYNLEDIRKNLVDMDELALSLVINQIQDPELKLFAEQAYNLRSRLYDLKTEREKLLDLKTKILEDNLGAINEIENEINDISEPYLIEWQEHLNFLKSRVEYYKTGNSVKDNHILDSNSKDQDDLILIKFKYAKVALNKIKADMLISYLLENPTDEKESGLLSEILNRFDVEEVDELTRIKNEIKNSISLDFEVIEEDLQPIKFYSNSEPPTQETISNITKRINDKLRDYQNEPRNLISTKDFPIILDYYERWVIETDNAYGKVILEETKELEDKKEKLIKDNLGSIDEDIKNLNERIKDVVEEFGNEHGRVYAENLLLTLSGKEVEEELPNTLGSRAFEDISEARIYEISGKEVEEELPNTLGSRAFEDISEARIYEISEDINRYNASSVDDNGKRVVRRRKVRKTNRFN